jgi:peroxiredoxin
MKKPLCILFYTLIILTAHAQSTKEWYQITGFLPNWNNAVVRLFIGDQQQAATTVQKDLFAFTGTYKKTEHAYLQVQSSTARVYVPMFIEPGIIRIRDAGNKNLIAFGTANNDLYVQLNQEFDSLTVEQKMNGFNEAIGYKKSLANAFIIEHPSSVVSLRLLKDYYYQNNHNDTTYYHLFKLLDKELQESFYGRKMIGEAYTSYKTAIGQPAPALRLKDSTGTEQNAYDPGNITLLQFWASWCLPCRKENPSLKKLYQKYEKKGLVLKGISLDTDKNLWQAAIKQEQLNWVQLSDMKGWSSVAAQQYGVRHIPTNYVIDKEGKIIAKNLTMEQLDTLLGKILGEDKSIY